MKIYNPQETSENVFRLAKSKGWSDSKLSQILELTPQAVSKWRRGIGAPSIDRLVVIADMFHISMDSLVVCDEIENAYCLAMEER